jgi:polysaccharide pyruvyl transferase WcaK-like protein
MKYFVYGYYGFGNFGDDLLLRVIIRTISESDPSARFIVRAREPIKEFTDLALVEYFTADSVLEDHKKPKIQRFLCYISRLRRSIKSCQVLVVGGGTLFIDKGRLNWSLAYLYFAVKLACRNSIPVVILGVSIDILSNPFSLWFTKNIFASSSFCALRDSLSLSYFHDTSYTPVLASDLAWLYPLPTEPVKPNSKPVIGLNFIDYFRTSTCSASSHLAYQNSIFSLIAKYYDSYDLRLISFQNQIGQRDDWLFNDCLHLFPLLQFSTVNDLASLSCALSGLAGVVSTRYHLGLLSARSNIPTCLIDHELKLTALSIQLSLPSVPLPNFIDQSSDPVELLLNYDSNVTLQRVNSQISLSHRNFSWLL